LAGTDTARAHKRRYNGATRYACNRRAAVRSERRARCDVFVDTASALFLVDWNIRARLLAPKPLHSGGGLLTTEIDDLVVEVVLVRHLNAVPDFSVLLLCWIVWFVGVGEVRVLARVW
jgi:hypothetical protein